MPEPLYQRYRLMRALRRGGGLSYQALDETLQQQVLVLEFFPPGARRLGSLALLPEASREALETWRGQLLATASIEGLQQAQLSFEQNGTHYAVTSLPIGETLMERLLCGRAFSAGEVQQLMLSLARSLEQLHARGLTDTLISPERISLIADGARLDLGWGRAEWPAALAPEQLVTPSRPVAASDIYALGASMLAALTASTIPGAAERAFGQPLPAMPMDTSTSLRQALEMTLMLRAEQRPDSAALVRLLRMEAAPVAARTDDPQSPQVEVIRAHQGWLTCLTADGSQVVTAGTDLRLRVFDWKGQHQRSLDLFDSRPVGLAFSPQGLVCGDQSGRVLVWNGQHIRQHISSGTAPQRLTRMLLQQDQRAVTLHDDGQLGAWDLSGPRLLGTAPLPGTVAAALHVTPGSRILVGSSHGEVLVFDEVTMRLKMLWQGEDRLPVTAMVAAEGQLLVAVGRRILTVSEGKARPVVTLPGVVHAMHLSPDGRALAVGGEGGLHIVRLADQQLNALIQGTAAVRSVYWATPGLAAGNDLGELMLVRFPGA